MTIIQPTQSSFINRLIILLVVVLLVEAFWLVMLYNNFVNTQHSFSAAQEELRMTHTENAELKQSIFALFDTRSLQALASAKGFIEERHPHYLQSEPQVSLAQR